MRLRFLGTGTSTGVPQIGCRCEACTSSDVHDHRLRASALLETPEGNILIDCGPDFRQQMLDAGSPDLKAALITHTHYDHVGGVDDMRPYCADGPFPIYCRPDVATDLRNRVPYCFVEHPYPGVPTFDLHEISEGDSLSLCGLDISVLPIMHAKLPILGFKFGNRLAYITDCKTMPEETVEALRGVDTLIINALRHEPHMSHLSLSESLALIERIGPRRAYLTHIAHQMGRAADVAPTLPDDVTLAYDGLTIENI